MLAVLQVRRCKELTLRTFQVYLMGRCFHQVVVGSRELARPRSMECFSLFKDIANTGDNHMREFNV